MTTTQMIEVLKTYPPDTEVVALWDGGWSTLDEHSLEKDKKGANVVEFDVTNYGTYDAEMKPAKAHIIEKPRCPHCNGTGYAP
jgi:hypothetical protein